MRTRALTAGLLTFIAAAPSAAAQRQVRPAGVISPLGDERLSDERRLTRWAHAVGRGTIRERPRASSRAVGRLRLQTEDRTPEVYIALESQRDVHGGPWVRIRIPGRPNGRRGWVRRSALGPLRVVRTHLVVDRRRLRATLRRSGKVIWTSRIGVGKRRTPTPTGDFYVRSRLRDLRGGTIYGPWAFGLSAYSVLTDWPGGGVVGIHGTNQPGLIPGRPSNGCVRVPNDRVRRLARLLPIGTPVTIR